MEFYYGFSKKHEKGNIANPTLKLHSYKNITIQE